MPEVDGFNQETYDAYAVAQVQLPKGDDMAIGTIVKQKCDHDGNPIGRHDVNPILDARIYEVEFPDGEVLEHAANVIAENLYSQLDEEGHHQVVFVMILLTTKARTRRWPSPTMTYTSPSMEGSVDV
jgi:hypothetical protein